MSNLTIYLLGMVLVISGLAYAANQVGIGQTWIVVGILVMLGMGIMGAVSQTRQKEAPPSS